MTDLQKTVIAVLAKELPDSKLVDMLYALAEGLGSDVRVDRSLGSCGCCGEQLRDGGYAEFRSVKLCAECLSDAEIGWCMNCKRLDREDAMRKDESGEWLCKSCTPAFVAKVEGLLAPSAPAIKEAPDLAAPKAPGADAPVDREAIRKALKKSVGARKFAYREELRRRLEEL